MIIIIIIINKALRLIATSILEKLKSKSEYGLGYGSREGICLDLKMAFIIFYLF